MHDAPRDSISRQRVSPSEPIRDCTLCPRLVSFRHDSRAANPDWHNAPVGSFGPPGARLLIVGLAPGLRGANRTGRPFTGDYAGDLLYQTLLEFGFAKGTYRADPADGLALVDCMITNAVRCVPPENKPTPAEIAQCRPFLVARIGDLPRIRAIVALGRIAHDSTLKALGLRLADYPFAHGARHDGARPAGDLRQLPLLALQYQHRAAHPGDVQDSIRGGPRRARQLSPTSA